MVIRREQAVDVDAVQALTRDAFAAPGAGEPVEPLLLAELRDDAGWLPALSLVAVEERGTVVGHVVCTRALVDDRPALGLGPIAVRPDFQGAGVGSALMHAVLGAAEALAEPAVVLLGDPRFYGRFGFVDAVELGIEPAVADWAPFFQVRRLVGDLPRGRFRYAAPFERLS